MIGGLAGMAGIGRRVARLAAKTSRRDTRSGFSVGGRRRHKSHVPLSAAQKARCERLRRLAPRPRKKMRRVRNFIEGGR